MGIHCFILFYGLIRSRCGLDDDSCEPLIKAICHHESLNGLGLDLGWNKITKKTFETLFQMTKFGQKLRHIEFLSILCERCEIKRDSVFFIGKLIESCQKLKHLTLGISKNSIPSKSYSGIMKKAEGLKDLVSLQLFFRFPDLEGDDGREFASSFGSFKSLRRLGLTCDLYHFDSVGSDSL